MVQTMLPVIARGRTDRRAEILPDEEFRARVDGLQQAMAGRGLASILAVGDRRDYGAVCYVTGLVPREGPAAVLIPSSGAPELFVGVASSRDLLAVSKATWLDDVRLLGDLWERLESLPRTRGGSIGFALPSRVASGIYRRVAAAPGLVSAADLVAAAMHELRPPDRALVHALVSMTSAACAAAVAAHGSGATPREAMIDAELNARKSGAHEVRMLIGDDRSMALMRPPSGVRGRAPSFIYYLAVEHLGYWADQWGTMGVDEEALAPARLELAAAIDRLRLGRPAGLTPPLAAGGPIGRLGLAYREPVDGLQTLSNGFYSLRHSVSSPSGSVLLSATIAVANDRVEVLS